MVEMAAERRNLTYYFEGYALDGDRRELRRGAELIALEPQVFDLLVFLIENHNRVVSKADIITAIWQGRAISDSTLTSRLNAARRAIGDSGEQQKLIRTVPRKGFRFVAALREQPDIFAGQPNPEPASRLVGHTAAGTPVDRGPSLHEYEWGFRAGLFFGWHQ